MPKSWHTYALITTFFLVCFRFFFSVFFVFLLFLILIFKFNFQYFLYIFWNAIQFFFSYIYFWCIHVWHVSVSVSITSIVCNFALLLLFMRWFYQFSKKKKCLIQSIAIRIDTETNWDVWFLFCLLLSLGPHFFTLYFFNSLVSSLLSFC